MYYQVLKPKSGDQYGNFFVYLPTSDPSGEYFVKYQFIYTLNAPKPELCFEEGTNDGCNQELYRIIEAYLMHREADGSFIPLRQLLQLGENELAMKEEGAGDFVGGYHGDERLIFLNLLVNGKTVALTKEQPLTECDCIQFFQNTLIYRCNSGTQENPFGTPICTHEMCYDIHPDSTITIHQKCKWLFDDFRLQRGAVCMMTMNRCTAKNERITDYLDYYRWDGSFIERMDVSEYGPGDDTGFTSSYGGPAYVIVSGKASGITAMCGYKAFCGLDKNAENFCWVRHCNDNKPYYFVNQNTVVKKGDFWNWMSFYRIDYVTPKE